MLLQSLLRITAGSLLITAAGSLLRGAAASWIRITVVALLFCGTASAAEVRIAVAANFLSTLKQLAHEYHQLQPDRLLISAGSSGGLYAQLCHGAPFDLFLSADQDRPLALEAQGLILPGSRFTYARGVLALWSSDPKLIDADGQVLTDAAYAYLSIAHPENAPYGTAARHLLQGMGLWSALEQQQRLIRAGNVRQALFQISSGAASLGFIALSQARHPEISGKGSLWVPDPSLYPPIVQQGVILAASEQPEATQRFVRWLQSTQARRLIVASGYQRSESGQSGESSSDALLVSRKQALPEAAIAQ